MDKTLRILLLEDSSVDAGLIEYELEDAGFTFTLIRVMTEKDFIQGLKTYSPDIILADYELPTYNGALALAEARKRCPEVPFILVTGRLSEDLAIETLTSGAKDYVMKHRLNRLAPAVRRAIVEADEIKARKAAEEELRQSHKNLENIVEERTAALQKELTERKQTEESLRESEKRYRHIVQDSTEFIGRTNADGTITFVNEALCRYFGMNRDSFVGKNIMEFIPDEERKSFLKFISSFTPQKPFAEIEQPVLMPNGNTRWHSWRVQAIYNLGGRFIEFQGAGFDITERKQAEERLYESERRERERAAELAALLDAVPTPIFIAHDPDCLHITGNRAADNFLRNPRGAEASLSAPDETKPRHFRAVKNGQELRTDELPAQRAARGLQVQDFEFSLVFDDGTTRHVVGHGMPLKDAEGHPRGAVHVLVDITERKQAEEELSKHRENLEILVKKRTTDLENKRIDLEEINTTLNVLLAQRGKDKQDIEENILASVKQLIMPEIEKIKSCSPKEKRKHANVIEARLKDMISPFANRLSSTYMNLTPKEIQVAYLIRDGFTTRQIAESLDISQGTVKFYRENIREKLDLKNKKSNLKSYLLTLS